MPKDYYNIINEDLSTGAVDVNSSRLYNTTAQPAAAHNTGENEQKEYRTEAPKKGKLGVIGQGTGS